MQNKILEHLGRLVSFYPVSNNQDSVLKALGYCENIMLKAGLDDATIHTYKGVHSLTGSTKSIKKPQVLLQAHIDVVPATEASRQFIRTKANLSGRGVYDMLFATACYLSFLELNQSGLADLDIGLMISGDEELGGFNGVKYLLDQGYGCDVCLLPDAGHGFGDINISAKGIFNFDLVCLGKAHHGSRPWEGDGAANKLVLLLHEVMDYFDTSSRENSTITITRLSGGDADNKGPTEASAHLDIRYRDKKDFKSISKCIEELSIKYDAELRNISLGDDYKLDTKNAYLKDFIKLYSAHVKSEVTLSKAYGSSDARFFSSMGIPVIMFRPDGTGAHADKETLSLVSLFKFYKLMEEFVLKTAKIKQ
jgi:succinyl-diaminopimelate desuccinylase